MMKAPNPNPGDLPKAPPNPPTFGEDAAARKPGKKSMNPTFLGSMTLPQPGQKGQSTLLGNA